MARRFVVNTWNNAAAVKKSKPIKPLRYRINPLEEQLDKLDALEAELERTADTLEPEHYHELYDSLQARRKRLEARRQRELGNAPAKATVTPQAATGRTYHVQKARLVERSPMSPFAVKVAAICIVVILFKIVA